MRLEYQTTLPGSRKICMQVKKQQLIPDMKQCTWNTGSKLRKDCDRLYIVTHLFNFYAEYIMWNAGLDEAQAGVKIARRNFNNLRYAGEPS